VYNDTINNLDYQQKEFIVELLPKSPNISETYYKITNQEESHNDLQYRDGLIIDPVEFNDDPRKSCVPGGIYFTTAEHLPKFLNYGIWIRPVTIPKDASVVLDPEGDKYRADKLFFHPRKNIDFYFDKLFDKKTFLEDYYRYLAEYCLDKFDIWFDKKTFPIGGYWYLAEYCLDKFDIWFDKKTFPIGGYWCLAEYCSDKFDVWFDKKTFPIKDYYYLAIYCSDKFDIWFDKKTFPIENYRHLAIYCSNKFNIWFDKETYQKEDYYYLARYCSDKKHIWDR
jgi:hypothetical protein